VSYGVAVDVMAEDSDVSGGAPVFFV
jgi:hypothetical protein